MCNLYRLTNSADEVAQFFVAIAQDMRVLPGNVPEEVYPGYAGLVVTEDSVRPMVWGFPLALTGAKGQPLKPKPVNNARTDKLSGPFWSASFRSRRCLIPVSAFAEAEGEKGSKTRCWFSLPDAPVMAIAGLWRPTAEWGEAYTMVMTSANETIACLHDRMPVILPPHSWQQWLAGDPHQALSLCYPYAGLITVDSTRVPWAGMR
ncbi:SOS response-associated peptidase [Altererythrobacter sp. KTW20L]|uniref:SOS response-associated peptidase n=1 Tax=Altererythrobacter sp. KTW20L TaxID=2942210 RepID=UPI0020C0FF09|nr:SOS response-associated peptidase [Altererythrobacter sp. KTW20L]MCL6252197.1 SOS response-associated peptidase [Altererythrobacter sp. KTW20L]